MMKVVRLTRQYNGFGVFSHRVEFIGRGPEGHRVKLRQWVRARNWLWTQFGPSSEQDLSRPEYFDGEQPKWAWDTDKSAIYLKEEAFTMFNLRKEYWENVENL